MVIVLFFALPFIFAYILNPIGFLVLGLPVVYLIACIVCAIKKKGRLFIGIGHLILATIIFVVEIVLFVGMLSSTASGSGDVILLIIPLLQPLILNIAFGLYFTTSKIAKDYFIS